nr:NYN domain-containing protein [Rhizohabitans arisaemae]
MDRCALFVDAGYLLADGAMAVHGTRHREAVSWDFPGVLQLLTGLGRERTGLPVLRCYWYEATVEGRRTSEHDALSDIPGLKLRLTRIRPGRREGVDAQVHRDLMTLARNNAICDAIVVSGDEDLAQVVCDAQDLGIRVTVVHISAEGNWAVSRTLRQECDDLIEVDSGHLRSYVNLVTGMDSTVLGGHQQLPASAQPLGNGQPHAGAQPLGNGPPLGNGQSGTTSSSSSSSAIAHVPNRAQPAALPPYTGYTSTPSRQTNPPPAHASPSPPVTPATPSPSAYPAATPSPPAYPAATPSGGPSPYSAPTPSSYSAPAQPLQAPTPLSGSGQSTTPAESGPPVSGSRHGSSGSGSAAAFSGTSSGGAGYGTGSPYAGPQPAPVPIPAASSGQGTTTLADAVKSAHKEGYDFGDSVARDAPALWLEAVLARKPRMPSDLEARLLQGSALPIDFLLHDEVRHALRRGFWDALERARR